MPEVSKEQIEKAREYFENIGQLTGGTIGKNTFVPYYVLPTERVKKEQGLGLSRFALQLSTNGGLLVGVSDNVREDFQPYWAYHESVCGREGEKGSVLSCEDASSMELSYVVGGGDFNFFREYVLDRRAFFEELVGFSRKDKNYTEEQREEFQKSLDFFKGYENSLRRMLGNE